MPTNAELEERIGILSQALRGHREKIEELEGKLADRAPRPYENSGQTYTGLHGEGVICNNKVDSEGRPAGARAYPTNCSRRPAANSCRRRGALVTCGLFHRRNRAGVGRNGLLREVWPVPKIKSKRSAMKRFRLTGTGKVRRNFAGKRHGMIKRTNKFIRTARGTTTASPADTRYIKRHLLRNS